jgi:hypothetical protein
MEEDEDNDEITESKDRNTEIIDTTMMDNEHTTTGLQEQEETTTSRNTTSTTVGDFNHQFKLHTTGTNTNDNTLRQGWAVNNGPLKKNTRIILIKEQINNLKEGTIRINSNAPHEKITTRITNNIHSITTGDEIATAMEEEDKTGKITGETEEETNKEYKHVNRKEEEEEEKDDDKDLYFVSSEDEGEEEEEINMDENSIIGMGK